VVEIDQIVIRVSEEGLSAMSAGPARRRVRRGDELPGELARSSEHRIVEHGKISKI